MKKIYLILLVLVVAFCTKNFEEFNKDTKSPSKVAGETLFSSAVKSLADQNASISVNLNVYNLFSQYVTETTYTDEANYDVITRAIPGNEFRILYRDVLEDLKESKDIINATTYLPTEAGMKKNQLAIIEVLSVYTWQRIVDIWGNVPYSESLNIDNTTPKYDDAATIYKDLFKRLDAAIADLDAASGSFGGADFIYAGDVAAWKLFANSLKLKLGMSVIDYSGLATEAKAAIEGAVTAGVFASNADNGAMTYLTASPNTSPVYIDLVLSGRFDFVAANTMVDIMVPIADPRLASYYQTRDTGSIPTPAYLGGIYGSNSAYANYSPYGTAFLDPTLQSVLLDYTEVCFYLAEAAAKGFTVGGTAESFYNAGIESSILYWGGSAADVATYLLNPGVAYATATGTFQQKIGTQAWIASFNRGFLGWTFWRRLDYPLFNMPLSISNYSDIPVRMTYPTVEQTLNAANYTAASSAIGEDLLKTKLFWDIH